MQRTRNILDFDEIRANSIRVYEPETTLILYLPMRFKVIENIDSDLFNFSKEREKKLIGRALAFHKKYGKIITETEYKEYFDYFNRKLTYMYYKGL